MGMKKRLLSTLLALTLSACVLPLQSRAAQEEEPVRIVDEIIQLPAIDTEIYSASQADENGTYKVDLKMEDGWYLRFEKWIDRLVLTDDEGATDPDYAIKFYDWLVENSSVEESAFQSEVIDPRDALVDPSTAASEEDRKVEKLESGGVTYYAHPVAEFSVAAGNNTALFENRRSAVAHITAVFDAFDRDHPEVFWLSGETWVMARTEYPENAQDNCTQTIYFLLRGFEGEDNFNNTILDIRAWNVEDMTQSYRNFGTLKTAVEDFEEAIESLIDQIPTNEGRGETIREINRLLTENNAYFFDTRPKDTIEKEEKFKKENPGVDVWEVKHNSRESISALQGGTNLSGPAYEGYSRAFKVLCDRLEIPCVLASGIVPGEDPKTPEDHMWNYVYMGTREQPEMDANWYAVDVTWNDPAVDEDGNRIEEAESGLENEDYLLVGGFTVSQKDGSYFQGHLELGASHELTNVASTYGTAFINGPLLSLSAYNLPDTCDHSAVSFIKLVIPATQEEVIRASCDVCGCIQDTPRLCVEDYEYDGTAHSVFEEPLQGMFVGRLAITFWEKVPEDETENLLSEAPRTVGEYRTEISTGAAAIGKEYTIDPRSVIVTLSGSASKVYDGNADVTNVDDLRLTVENTIEGDDVTASAAYFTYHDETIGTEKMVTAHEVTLQGADKDNYELLLQETSAEVGSIVEKAPENEDSSDSGSEGSVTYDLTTHEISVSASGLTATPSSNAGTNSYSSYAASPVRSVLAAEDGGFVRAEYVDDSIVVEWFDSSYQLLKQKTIPQELPVFGGIYLGEDHNFVVCGENNPGGDSAKEAIRIIRYSKDWEREAAAGVLGTGTLRPFEAGSLRFARSGDYLYIRTGHQTLQEQSSLMLNLRISDMTVTDDSSRETGPDAGVFPSSFNQFLLTDGTDLLALDHSAADPRGVVLTKFDRQAGQDKFTGPVTREILLPIAASSGDPNDTGVSLGGFAVSDTHYLAAGSSCVQKDGVDQSRATQNIFLTVTPKDQLGAGKTTITWFTDHSAISGVKVSAPHLVKTGPDRFCLLWAQEDQIHYCMLDGQGNQISDIFTGEAGLSDCVPIVADDKLIWYVTENGAPVFHEIRLHSGSHVHYHEEWTLVREATCEEDGLRQRSCRLCSEVESEPIPAPGHSYSGDLCTRCGHDRTAGLTIHRIYGQERCETARKVAEELKQELGIETFDTILYTSGLNFADALAGSYLAAQKNAPILLHLEGGAFANLSYIKNNLAEGGTVIILGGENAVPKTMDEALAELGINVRRLAGDNRYRTNLKILEDGGFAGGRILVCTSLSFADSLSASATGLPILLVAPTAKELTQEQKNFLNPYIHNCEFILVGGKNAVTEELENALESYGTVERLAGQTRYETSVLVAAKFFEAPEEILLAYAVTFPDGLCGGVLAHARNVPLILTHPQQTAMAEHYALSGAIKTGTVLGGPGLIGNETVEDILS